MGDNDFPLIASNTGGIPQAPLDDEMLRRLKTPVSQPPGGYKEFLKKYLENKGTGTDLPQASGYQQDYVRGLEDYSQAGTDIPSLRMQDKYAQESGGPIFGETLISSTPSFDLRFPKMPGIGSETQSVEGIPNASPELLRKFVERKTKNPGGQELPGFLKGA